MLNQLNYLMPRTILNRAPNKSVVYFAKTFHKTVKYSKWKL